MKSLSLLLLPLCVVGGLGAPLQCNEGSACAERLAEEGNLDCLPGRFSAWPHVCDVRSPAARMCLAPMELWRAMETEQRL